MLAVPRRCGVNVLRRVSRPRSVQQPGFAVLVVASLVAISILPIYSSADSNGGLLFDANSLTLDGDGEVGEGSLWVNLTVMEMLGDHANATLQANLSTIEGVPATKSQVIAASADSTHQITLQFTDVAVGIYTLEINLSGDVDGAGVGPDNASGADWRVDWSGIVTKLRPLSVGLASTGQWDMVAVDNAGNISTNDSVRDGDNLSVAIPVVNYGDVNATGYLQWSFDGGSISSTAVNSPADMTTIFSIELGIVAEGEHSLAVSANFSNDADSSDNSATLLFAVGPPPLPRLNISLSSTTAAAAELGASVDFTLMLANDGEVDWSGLVECTTPDANSVVFSAAVSIAVGQSQNHTVNITATPGRFECVLKDGGRITTDSTVIVTFPFSMQAAEFTTVGGGGGEISIAGGPWHVGDVVSTNLLVYNDAEHDGTATLFLRHGSSTVSGPDIAIASGGGGLLVADVTVSATGDSVIEWWVSSLDATVSGELAGNFTISVLESQSLQPVFTSVVWDASSGISSAWTVELSPGIERVVGVEIGITVDGIDKVRQQYHMSVSPGQRAIVSQLGEFTGQGEVYVRLTPQEWLTSGSSEASMSIPAGRPILRLVQESETEPGSPVESTSVTVTCTLFNDGQATSKGGMVRLLDADGRVLDEKTSQPLDASQNGRSVAMNVSSWPAGQVVDIQCWWRVGDATMVADHSHISAAFKGEDEGIAGIFPLTFVIYGIIAAVVITLVSRLAYGWKNASPGTVAGATGQSGSSAASGASGTLSRKEKSAQKKAEKSAQREKRSAAARSTSSGEKTEVPCPSCEQKLSIPATFSGTVRCPSCRHEFDVSAEPDMELPAMVTSPGEDEVEDELEPDGSSDMGLMPRSRRGGRAGGRAVAKPTEPEPAEPETQVVVSESDILPCPECEVKLRVPMEKRPVRARCPACKTEFMAHSN